MSKIHLTVLFLMILTTTFGQRLIYRDNGKIYDYQGQKLSPDQVREIYSSNYEFLDLYNEGRAKKIVGNIFLIAGAGMVITDLMVGLFQDEEFQITTTKIEPNGPDIVVSVSSDTKKSPTVLTYIGLATTLIAIPIKIGYSKKIKKSVDDYNKTISTSVHNRPANIEFVANAGGLGLRFSLN
ncbi:MAG: hypothetical protein ACI7YS_03455 [Flavobacterium sp.]